MQLESNRRTRSLRVWGLGTLMGLALVGLALAAAGNAAGDRYELLASEAEIEALAGGSADRCHFAAPQRKVCRWHLDGLLFQPGEAGGAKGVNLVCSLPSDPTAGAGRCLVHAGPQQARIDVAAGNVELPPVGARGPGPDASERVASAQNQLATALDIIELSHLVGNVPDSCALGWQVHYCSWTLASGSEGHVRLAALSADAGDAELRCVLPLDGSPRTKTSCEVGRPL